MIRAEKVKKYIANKGSTIKEVLRVIDQNKGGVALVVDENLKLLGIITDGDVRRFILRHGDLDSKCETVMNRAYVYTRKDSLEEVERLMGETNVRHVPLLGKGKKLIKVFVSDMISDLRQRVIAVVMAGGEGKRLKEVSRNVPKPLVKIERRTVLEDVIVGLRDHNVKDIYLSVGYKAQAIKDHIEDGSRLGVTLKYVEEKKKLGTAGALSLLREDEIPKTILVINADVLTATNYTSLIDFYHKHHLLMCIASKEYIFDVPYGVFDVCNGYLTGIKEKPSLRFFCNAGIYVLDREILRLIPKNKKFDMTDLMKLLLHKSLPIGAFPLYEYWIDIGNAADLSRAKSEYNALFKKREYE
jgi:dTDP-glucose pyrophosphorylase